MKTKRILSLLMAGALLTGALTGCGGKKDDSAQSGDSSGVITINYPTFQCGTNTSAPVCDELIKEFNEKYAGKYEIKKEDVPGDQNYIDKIKVQLGTGDLPPVIYGGGYNLLDMVVAKDLAVDLTDAVNSDADWKALYSDTALATNSRDGKIYASSMEGQVIGYFYNKELFKQAGITEPAKTWDEFFQQCDKLKAAGITPLSMDTADSACNPAVDGRYGWHRVRRRPGVHEYHEPDRLQHAGNDRSSRENPEDVPELHHAGCNRRQV